MNPNVDSKKLIEENKLFKERLADYEQLKRKVAKPPTQNLAVSEISKRLNEKMHIVESNCKINQNCAKNLKNTKCIVSRKDRRVKTRHKIAAAIKAVPDSIVVLNTLRATIDRNEKDLAIAKLLLDSTLDPMDAELESPPESL